MKIYFVFTGLIRIPNLFYKSVDELLVNHNIKGIILSTWEGEEVNPKYLDKVTVLREKILQDDQKNISSFGNSVDFALVNKGQSLHIYRAIQYIQNNDNSNDIFIFKSRPDVWVSQKLINQVISLDYTIDQNKYDITAKIWIAWAHALKPFYIEDLFYFTDIHTMLKLCNLNDSKHFEKMFGHQQGKAHIVKFVQPFIKNEIRKYYFLEDPSYNYQQIQNQNIDNILKLLIEYYNILNNYFIFNPSSSSDMIFKNGKMESHHRYNSFFSCKINNNMTVFHNNFKPEEAIRHLKKIHKIEEQPQRCANVYLGHLKKR